MINSLDTRSRMAEKLSIPQLQKAVQDGTIPSFIGIPLLNEKVANAQKAKMGMAAQQASQNQPTLADQVMQQAKATIGIPALATNLSDEESYANGGIVAFAGGGPSMSSIASQYLGDEDDDEMDYVRAMLAGMEEQEIPEDEESSEEDIGEEGSNDIPLLANYMRESTTAKKEGLPAQTVGREKESVYAPVGGISPELLSNIRTDRPSSGVDDSLLKHVLHKESRGQRYDKDGNLLTSPKGAQGEMQVMPGTQRDPGYGVIPARDNSPDEMARVGRDYLKAMQARYKDPKLAAVAYNWGPGNTDKWLMAGADPSKLPQETKKYIQGLAGGGIASIKHFQYGGISGTSPFDIKSLGLDDLKRMASMGEKSAIDELVRRQSDLKIGSARAPSPTAAQMNLSNPTVTGGSPSASTGFQKASTISRAPNLLGRLAVPAGIAAAAYDIGSGVMDRKQAEELAKYGQEPEPTAEELERASRPSFGATMNRQKQQQLGIAPLAPLTYTPAGVQTYGNRPNYTPPSQTLPSKVTPAAPSAISPITGGRTGSADLPNSERGGAGYIDPIPDTLQDANEAVAKEQADLLGGQAEMLANKEEAGAVKKEEGVKELSGLEKLIAERIAASKSQREIDNYMALLSAGLGMMGGTSPYAAANIGQGALQGVASYQRSGAQRAQEDRDIMSGQLALEKYGPLRDIQRGQLEAKERYNRDMLEAKKFKDREAIRQRQEKLGQNQAIADSKSLDRMQDLMVKKLIADKKGAYTDAMKAQVEAEAQAKLNSSDRYRRLYKSVHNVDPGGEEGIFDYDMNKKSIKR